MTGRTPNEGSPSDESLRVILTTIGVSVHDGVVPVPVVVDGQERFRMSYQHDLIVESGGQLRAIGSVKTSSKDRLDKIFIDKFLYNKLTNADTPTSPSFSTTCSARVVNLISA